MVINHRGWSCLLATLLVVPVAGSANMWSCTQGDQLREISVEYEGSANVPCNVVYNKPTEGEAERVLWFADSMEGFCEEQAEAFVVKLESWGWECAANVKQIRINIPDVNSD